MTKLVPPSYCWRLHARGSRFVGIRTSRHGGGVATVKRQTGLVSRDLGGRISGDREKSSLLFQCQYCLIFTAATRLSFHKQSPCVYASRPVQGIVACVRVGGGGFELHKQSYFEDTARHPASVDCSLLPLFSSTAHTTAC